MKKSLITLTCALLIPGFASAAPFSSAVGSVDEGIELSGDQGYGRTDAEALNDDLNQEQNLIHQAAFGGGFMQTGVASNYWQPQPVACGGRFNPSAMTAAHKSLPCGTVVKVTNLKNGKSVTVRINDRGPYIKGRIIDLSRSSFLKIASAKQGLAKVKVEVISKPAGKKKKKARGYDI